MGLMDKLRGEFVDIIEWLEDSRTLLAWRFPRYQNEIKQGAQLIVREDRSRSSSIRVSWPTPSARAPTP